MNTAAKGVVRRTRLPAAPLSRVSAPTRPEAITATPEAAARTPPTADSQEQARSPMGHLPAAAAIRVAAQAPAAVTASSSPRFTARLPEE